MERQDCRSKGTPVGSIRACVIRGADRQLNCRHSESFFRHGGRAGTQEFERARPGSSIPSRPAPKGYDGISGVILVGASKKTQAGRQTWPRSAKKPKPPMRVGVGCTRIAEERFFPGDAG